MWSPHVRRDEGPHLPIPLGNYGVAASPSSSAPPYWLVRYSLTDVPSAWAAAIWLRRHACQRITRSASVTRPAELVASSHNSVAIRWSQPMGPRRDSIACQSMPLYGLAAVAVMARRCGTH